MSFTFVRSVGARQQALITLNTLGCNFLVLLRVSEVAMPTVIDSSSGAWTLEGSYGTDSTGVVTIHTLDNPAQVTNLEIYNRHPNGTNIIYGSMIVFGFNRTAGALQKVAVSGRTQSGTSPSAGGITTPLNNALVVAGLGSPSSAGTVTIGSSFAELSNQEGVTGTNFGLAAAIRNPAPAGSYDPVWSITTSLPTSAGLFAVMVSSGDVVPTISTQPQNQTVTEPATATFSVTAAGSPPLSYQWRLGGVNISGATSASYTTPATDIAHSGRVYSVVVTNSAGSVTSSDATLTVNADNILPVLTGSINVSALTSTSYTLTWPQGTDNLSYAGVDYSLDGGDNWTTLGNVLTVNITGRTPATTDQVRVRGRDSRGNLSSPVLSTSVTLPAGADTTPPTLTGTLAVTAITQNSYVVTCPVATDNVGVVAYQWRVNSGTWTEIPNLSRIALVSGRTAGATDNFQMRARDAAGNFSTALSVNVTLLSAPATFSLTAGPFFYDTGSPYSVSLSVNYTLIYGGDIGSVAGALLYEGTGTLNGTTGLISISGILAAGNAVLWVKHPNDPNKSVWYEEVTIS